METQYCTFSWQQKPLGHIVPRTEKELQALLKQYPEGNLKVISQGKNWGFGSACANQSDLLVDLTGFTESIKMDEQMGVVTVSPSITFAALADYLKTKNSNFKLDPSGAGKDTSVMGNYLVKGHGLTRTADHINQIMSYRGFDRNGKPFQSWHPKGLRNDIYAQKSDFFAHYPHFKNVVITELCIALSPKANSHKMISIRVNDECFAEMFDQLNTLKKTNFFDSNLLIANAYRQLLSNCPLQVNLPEKYIEQKRLARMKDWLFVFSLYEQNEAIADAKLDYLKSLNFSDVEYFSEVDDCVDNYLSSCFLLSAGMPVEKSRRLYRGKNLEKQIDYDQDRCGFYWLTATIKSLGSEVQNFVQRVQDFHLQYGLQAEINLFNKRDQVTHAHLGLTFDLQDTDQAKFYKKFYKDLSAFLQSLGYLPHRSGIQDS